MNEEKVKYIIGVKDRENNHYIVTDISKIASELLIPVSKNIDVKISKAYFYPYNTFKKDIVLPSEYSWAVLKMRIYSYKRERKYTVDDAWVEDTHGTFVEEINHKISLANTFIRNLHKAGKTEIAAEIRKRILTEQAYFSILKKGCIHSYLDLLNNKDFLTEKEGNDGYKFPLTIKNINWLDYLLEQNVPIDYSILINSKQFGRFGSFIRDGEIEDLSIEALVTLFSNIPVSMMDLNVEYQENEDIVLEAYRQGNYELMTYLMDLYNMGHTKID